MENQNNHRQNESDRNATSNAEEKKGRHLFDHVLCKVLMATKLEWWGVTQ